MTDLLLITDIPRLSKIFSGLNENKSTTLRSVSSLELGAAELAAAKPDIVFVQPHLSGLSAEIILMHLKKQLGRKRSRFVLLASADQAGDAARLYQGTIDPSAEDDVLYACIQETIAALLAKPSRKSVAPAPPVEVPRAAPAEVPAATTPAPAQFPQLDPTPLAVSVPVTAASASPPIPVQDEPSLEEQGITYAPRARLSVYSEFTSSFDSAVDSMAPSTPLEKAIPEQHHDWNEEGIETVSAPAERSRGAAFLLWLAPVVIAVVVVTFLQQKRVISSKPTYTQKPSLPVATAPTAPPATTAAPAQPIAAVPAAAKPAPETEQAINDKAVLSAIAETRPKSPAQPAPAAGGRPTVLPDFIPRYALDKSYSQGNPGWERYKGQVTEFKVFREGSGIKAIQVIDRGGNGVPESFMKAAVRQVSKNPAVVMEASEKKEGYEIQRGQTGDNLKVMFYRDEQGGKLRAFVLTWK